jgi:hypothetical protein
MTFFDSAGRGNAILNLTTEVFVLFERDNTATCLMVESQSTATIFKPATRAATATISHLLSFPEGS